MQSFIKNFIVIAGLIALASIGYYLYTANKTSRLSTSNNSSLGSADIQAQQFLQDLDQLKTIKLSDGVFASPLFNSFKSYSTPVIPEGVGRDNPFTLAQ